MTWNVLYKEKADNILSFVKKIDPDILCCQELTLDSHFNPGRNIPAEIAKQMSADYEYCEALKTEDEKTHEYVTMGNAIFSKFPIVGRRHVFVQKVELPPESAELENRVYVETILDINGYSLKVATVHLSYVPHFTMTEKKLVEAEELYKATAENTKQFVLTGDMNALPGSDIINQLSAGLVNAGPDFEQKTWTTKPFSYAGFEANDLNWRLDYIFTTKDIKVLSSQIIKTDFSDHLPILAEIQT